ncbi:hypothetical protein BJX61DRAFT_542166 [Aspergillus egyptiacus]|nr:hypothetical protein BJX61DRAFT_542166 [Aspergillus egyptiacus]
MDDDRVPEPSNRADNLQNEDKDTNILSSVPKPPPRTRTRDATQLEKWYEEGKAFFTREPLRDIQRQLQLQGSLKWGDEIVVTGLDGCRVGFRVILGENEVEGSEGGYTM